MSISFGTAKSIVTESLGGSPAVTSASSIVNMAGRLVFGMRQWRFNRQGPDGLDLVQDSDEVALPSGFGGIVGLSGSNENPIELVDPEFFALLKTGSQSWGTLGFAGVLVSDRSGFNPADDPILKVYPTPTEDVSDAFYLVYTTRWVAVGPSDGDDSDTSLDGTLLPAPDFMDALLVEALQLTARGVDESDVTSLSSAMTMLKAGEVFRSASRDDLRRYRSYPTLSNGIGQYRSRIRPTRDQAEWTGR
jgi:hypothetical protein